MRFAYADPPYLGTSKFGAAHHYGDRHPEAAVYDTVEGHATLVERLVADYPDGWALSLSATTLRTILPLCPPDVRVCPWVKGWCSWKPGVHPFYAWEPVILRGGRMPPDGLKVRDWVMCNATTGKKLPGVKPRAVCEWVLALLGYTEGDELVDLFPGSGIMGVATSQRRLELTDVVTQTALIDGPDGGS